MVKEILHNIWIWSWYSKEKGYNFNGTIVSDGRTKVLIDPVRLSDDKGRDTIQDLGPFEAIYLTNKDHERLSYDLRSKWKVPVWIHEEDQDFLKENADYTFRDSQKLACGIRVIHLENQKSPGESAFYLDSRGVLILGDALIGNPPGHLSLLPSVKYQDIEKARESLKRFTELRVDSLLVGDGVGVFQGVDKAFAEFFQKELGS